MRERSGWDDNDLVADDNLHAICAEDQAARVTG